MTKPGKSGSEIIRKRCLKCKKIRTYKFGANFDWGQRKYWKRLERDGERVCHICVARANGDPLPLTHGRPGKENKRLIKIIDRLMEETFPHIEDRYSWMRSINPEFDGLSPLELLWKGKYGIIIDYLEDILLGHMS